MGLGDTRRDSMINEDMSMFRSGGEQGARLINLREDTREEDEDSDISDDMDEDTHTFLQSNSQSPDIVDIEMYDKNDTFWNGALSSSTMRQMRDTRASQDAVYRRINTDRKELTNPLVGRRYDGTYGSLYTSSNIFPDKLLKRDDLAEVDRIIKEQHLSRALKALPHLRQPSDLDLVSSFVLNNWKKAQSLGPKRVNLLAKCVSYFLVQAGDYILTEGESSRTFYIIVSGEVDIHKRAAVQNASNGIVATLGAGQSFGEISLEIGGGCTASVIAKSEVELLVLYKSDYDQIMKETKEQERADALHILKNIPMFKNWARSRLERVAQLLKRKRFVAGTPIVKQGDPPDNVYFIHEGVCEVTKDITIEKTNCWPTGPRTWKKVVRSKKVPFKILDLHRGGFFGEKAIIEDNVRAATVSAVTDVWVFYVDKVEFMSLLNMGYKAQSDAKGGMQGYPNDEDILSLFSSLKVTGGTKTGPSNIRKPKKITAKMKKEEVDRASTAPNGAMRQHTKLPKSIRSPSRQKSTRSVFEDDAPVPSTQQDFFPTPKKALSIYERFGNLRDIASYDELPSVYRIRSPNMVATPVTPGTHMAPRRIKTPKFVMTHQQSMARLDGVRSTTNASTDISSNASFDLTTIASPLTAQPRRKKKFFID